MITIYGLFICVGIFMFKGSGYKLKHYGIHVIIFLILVLMLRYQLKLPTRWEVKKVTPIYSLTINGFSEGSFILGGGSIDGVEYYCAFKKVEGELYDRIKVEAEKSFIKETYETPCIEYHVEVPVNHYPWYLGGPYAFSNYRYLIKIPKNSIIRDFRIK